jgi:hypothetical protein
MASFACLVLRKSISGKGEKRTEKTGLFVLFSPVFSSIKEAKFDWYILHLHESKLD